MKLNSKTIWTRSAAGAALAVALAGAVMITSASAQNMPAKQDYFWLGKGKESVEKRAESATGTVTAVEKITGMMTSGKFRMMDELWKPGYSVPAHFHKERAEIVYVMSGQVEYTIDGQTQIMQAGDAVFVPPNVVHHSKTYGQGNARLIMLYSPGRTPQKSEMVGEEWDDFNVVK